MAFTEIDPSEIPAQFRAGNAPTGLTEIDPTDVPAEFQHKNQTSTFDAIGAGLAKGLTFGFDDEIVGALKTLAENGVMPWQDAWNMAYTANRDASRKFSETAENEHPIATMAGDVGGMVVTAPKTIAGATLTGAARMAGEAMPWALRGAVRGAGDAKEIDDVPGGIIAGGAAGGATGAAGPLLSGAGRMTGAAAERAGTALGGVADRVFDYTNKGVGKMLTMGNNNVSNEMADWIGRAATAWGTGGQSLAAELGAKTGAKALQVGGKGMNTVTELLDNPQAVLQSVRGTPYYQPLLNAATTSPTIFKGTVMNLIQSSDDFRKAIGYKTDENE